MTTVSLASLPLQVLCQLILPGVPGSGDIHFVKSTTSQFQSSTLPIGYVLSGSKAALLGRLPLGRICESLATTDLGTTEDSTLAGETKKQTPPVTPPALPEGYVTFLEDRAAYKIYEENLTWDQARERCNAEGARLAIPDSHKKLGHIIRGLKEKNEKVVRLHVGIRRSNTTNNWVRVDNGLPATCLPWDSNFPFGFGDCVHIVVTLGGLWDASCTEKDGFSYVCEIPI